MPVGGPIEDIAAYPNGFLAGYQAGTWKASLMPVRTNWTAIAAKIKPMTRVKMRIPGSFGVFFGRVAAPRGSGLHHVEGYLQQEESRHDAKRLDGDAEELEDEVPKRGEQHQHGKDGQGSTPDHRCPLSLGAVRCDGEENRDVTHCVQRDEERHERGDEERQQRVHQRPGALALLNGLRGFSVDSLPSSLYSSRSRGPTDFGVTTTKRTY